MCQFKEDDSYFYLVGCPLTSHKSKEHFWSVELGYCCGDHGDLQSLLNHVSELTGTHLDLALLHISNSPKVTGSPEGREFLASIQDRLNEIKQREPDKCQPHLAPTESIQNSKIFDERIGKADQQTKAPNSGEDELLNELESQLCVTVRDILRDSGRSAVFDATNGEEDFVLRVTVFDSSLPSIKAVMNVFSVFAEMDSDSTGLVPMHSLNIIRANETQYMVERYSRITFRDNESTDLFEFLFKDDSVMSQSERKEMALIFLGQVSLTIAFLHEQGFCHMDISLCNIVVSPSNAYLIDFESTIPCPPSCDDLPYLVEKKAIQVPVKWPLLPIEHYFAKDNDLVSLRDYDVWAWAASLFLALFGHDLMPQFDEPEAQLMLNHFLDFGFQSYVQHHHPTTFAMVFDANHEENTNLVLAWDLLCDIFIVPQPKIVEDRTVWYDGCRLRADSISIHQLWSQLEEL